MGAEAAAAALAPGRCTLCLTVTYTRLAWFLVLVLFGQPAHSQCCAGMPGTASAEACDVLFGFLDVLQATRTTLWPTWLLEAGTLGERQRSESGCTQHGACFWRQRICIQRVAEWREAFAQWAAGCCGKAGEGGAGQEDAAEACGLGVHCAVQVRAGALVQPSPRLCQPSVGSSAVLCLCEVLLGVCAHTDRLAGMCMRKCLCWCVMLQSTCGKPW